MNKRGFTLIELLVVITIIAILAVIVFTQVQGLTARARNTTTQTTVREAGNSVNVFRNSDGTADSVIRPGSGETAALSLVSSTGNAAFGPFTGTIVTTEGQNDVLDASDLQYPVRITRTASAATATTGHALVYRIMNAGATIANSGDVDRTMYTMGAAECVIFAGALVNDATASFSFYRNGTVGTGGAAAGTGGTNQLVVGNIACTTP